MEWLTKLQEFQEHVLLQFGFLKCHLDRSLIDMRYNVQPQDDRRLFVHGSGNTFVMIPQENVLEHVTKDCQLSRNVCCKS